MKVLYTSHINGTHVGITQAVLDIPHTVLVGSPVDSLVEHIAASAGIAVDDLLIPGPLESPDSFVVNEYGVFIAGEDCHESYVLIG